jgi:hypothetical protein
VEFSRKNKVRIMSRDVSLDNPAQQRQDDEFNRWPFSKRLADTIAAFDASEGAPKLFRKTPNPQRP